MHAGFFFAGVNLQYNRVFVVLQPKWMNSIRDNIFRYFILTKPMFGCMLSKQSLSHSIESFPSNPYFVWVNTEHETKCLHMTILKFIYVKRFKFYWSHKFASPISIFINCKCKKQSFSCLFRIEQITNQLDINFLHFYQHQIRKKDFFFFNKTN